MLGFESSPGYLDCYRLTSGQFTGRKLAELCERNETERAGHVKGAHCTATPQLSHASLDLQVLVAEVGGFHQKTAQSPEPDFFISDYM